ncbi:hypothetical protein V6N12_057537 [Hibiscus sabdariffa]|uniref:Endonuclease/exonuclease/phosphatase domain-containing protein n=1 Tax=Hibiscus sabdariffa TaxID=183260 RepID=A0ABR2C5H2_9ROSI
MIVLSWNVRGLGSNMKFSAVRKLIRKVKAEMVLLQETKKEAVTEREVAKLWYDDAFNFVESSSIEKLGGLLLIWDSSKFKMEKCQVNVRYIPVSGIWANDLVATNWLNVYGWRLQRGKEIRGAKGPY